MVMPLSAFYLFSALVSIIHEASSQPQHSSFGFERQNDLEFLCHHYYPEEFTINSKFLETGCSIACTLLTTNGEYYEGSIERVHDVNEGRQCEGKKVCNKGLCIEPMGTGKATITILRASSRHKSSGMRSGAVVKVYIDGNYLVKTRESEDVISPKWHFSFVTPVISFDTKIEMVLVDYLMEQEEYLTTVSTSPKLVVDMGMEGGEICSEGENSVCFMMKWTYEME